MKNLMTGLDAMVFGLLDSGVKIVTGVPGFPITELMDALPGKIKHEWSINEKVALEVALGSSVCGERSAVITKHVGMNILADPLVSSATHTIGAGVVIIAGDDPGVQKSQNEQDSRYFGLVAEVPVFDPTKPDTAYRCIGEAFLLSEEASTPVIIRVTDRLLKSKSEIIRKTATESGIPDFDRKIWLLTMLGKHQRFHKYSFPKMCEYSEKSNLNSSIKRGGIGIISSGYPSSLVESVINDNISHISLQITNPLPKELVHGFINNHVRVLVVEETEPVIERQLTKRVLGKLTGHLPFGIIEVNDILEAIEKINDEKVESNIIPQQIKERGARPLCEDCPYLPLYDAIKELDVPVAGDVGCSILASSPPLSIIDAAFSLGSSVGTASGFNRKGIAVIGDFGLAHSGIAGIINAVHNKHDLLAIVLQNEVSAMTGGQGVPDLTELVSVYVKDTTLIDPRADNLKDLLDIKLKTNGVSVILARARCPKF